MVAQTWKFSDNKIEVEEAFAKTTMLTAFRWPATHRFAPNVEQKEREAAMTGFTLRWHGGKSFSAMKTFLVPYNGGPVGPPPCGDWVENQGPWGARKVTLKRKNNNGSLAMGENGNTPFPYCGQEVFYVPPPYDNKTKRITGCGFELKVD